MLVSAVALQRTIYMPHNAVIWIQPVGEGSTDRERFSRPAILTIGRGNARESTGAQMAAKSIYARAILARANSSATRFVARPSARAWSSTSPKVLTRRCTLPSTHAGS